MIRTEFLRSFLRRHLVGNPAAASPNVGCFPAGFKKFLWQKYNPRHDVMHFPYINGLDSMDCRFLQVVTSPWESAIFVVITVNWPLSYLGMFFHRLYILPCRYRCTIREYWSSWHWCHIREKKHRIRQCLEQQTYWLMKKLLRGI